MALAFLQEQLQEVQLEARRRSEYTCRQCRTSAGASKPLSDDMSQNRSVSKSTAATIYGIKNCDTIKKARDRLDGHGVAYVFHDYKIAGIERSALQSWAHRVGWEALLKRSRRVRKNCCASRLRR